MQEPNNLLKDTSQNKNPHSPAQNVLTIKQTLPSIASQQEIYKLQQKFYGNKKNKYHAFYNSIFNKIILEEHLMLMPIDDRTAVRGHGAFDVAYVRNGRINNLNSHIDRLYSSSKSIDITPPLSKARLKQLIFHLLLTLQSHTRQYEYQYGIRMIVSSGWGDLNISCLNKQSILYILVFTPYLHYQRLKEGVKEYSFPMQDHLEIHPMVHSKTVNYVNNARLANQSQKLNGYLGIKATRDGFLLQAAVDIGFILHGKFVSPRLETVIEGTTIRKLNEYIVILLQQKILQGIEYRDVKVEQAYEATQMMIIGGDKIVPVLTFNDKVISHEVGPITKKMQAWYEEQKMTEEDIHQALNTQGLQ